MDSYWYITKSKTKPKNRKLVSVVVRKNYTMIELAIEADCDMIKKYGLRYIGYGCINDQMLQMSLLRIIKHLR